MRLKEIHTILSLELKQITYQSAICFYYVIPTTFASNKSDKFQSINAFPLICCEEVKKKVRFAFQIECKYQNLTK